MSNTGTIQPSKIVKGDEGSNNDTGLRCSKTLQ